MREMTMNQAASDLVRISPSGTKVRTIPATVQRFAPSVPLRTRLRVAAYARVSTDEEEQLSSYEAQVDYYTHYIQSNPEWSFVEVYADEEHSYPALFSVQINEKVAGVAPAEYRKMTVN